MNPVAGCLAHGIKAIHTGLALVVHPDASHIVMLCRNDRNTFLGDIITFFHATFYDIGEMRL